MALAYYLHIPRRPRRSFFQLFIYLSFLLTFWILTRYTRCKYSNHTRCWSRTWDYKSQLIRPYDREARLTIEESRKLSPQIPGKPTVNIVVASVVGDDISWLQRVTIPNMAVIRYYTDDPTAKYHPKVSKGREALMYHTYLYDFYDSLPDISIFIHAHESPWHVEPILMTNLSYALNRLNLNEVIRRDYVNLRVSWQGACPDWINMTKTESEMDGEKLEEPYMSQFWRENFPLQVSQSGLPEIVAQPCCSQFAVTRKAVRNVERARYKEWMEWLVNTDIIDYISGRFWEHSFQFVFTGREIDCPVEVKAYCRTYGICFESQEEVDEHMSNEWDREWLLVDLEGWKPFWHPRVAKEARDRIKELDKWLEESRGRAIERGMEEEWMEELGDIYEE